MTEESARQMNRWYHLVLLNAYFLGVSFMWNSLHPIILPLLLLSLVSEQVKNTSYGLLTFLGLLVALVVQPLSGALSDLTRHPLGRRRPWIIVGTLASVVCLLVLALARHYVVVVVGYILLQLSSNVGHGPAQALIPDTVAQGKRGAAAGMKNLLDMLGLILASLIASRLGLTAMTSATPRPLPAVAVISVVLLGATLVTVLGVRESPVGAQPAPTAQRPSLEEQVQVLRRLDLRQSGYGRLLLARFWVLLGTFAVQAFALYYVRDGLRLPAPERVVGNLMTIIGLSITLVVYPAGLFSERWGRKGLSVAACALTGLGMLALLWVRDLPVLMALACVIGIGMGIFASVNWAWATTLVPTAEAGKYLGLTNLATAGSAATSRLLGPLIDLANAQAPNAGYALLFLIAATGAFLGLVILLRTPENPA